MAKINRLTFYKSVRDSFGGSLNQRQVDGIEAILNEWEAEYADEDLEWLAYALGTVWHETDRTMAPIEEYGRGGARWYAKPDAETGHAYFGRGLVQLTHKANYATASAKLNIDLVHQPELALDLNISVKILLRGMAEGWFTGARFDWYFNNTRGDWINARRIINGLDRAELVAGYSKKFFQALNATDTVLV